jgi:16S rRNA (cytosine1402-N4)-methyltransferase
MAADHIPVLMRQVLEVLRPGPGQTIVDCTVGLGGHAAELLRRISPGGRLIGIDLDPHNLELASQALSARAADCSFTLFNTNFAGLPGVLAQAGVERADAILADLGVASPQIDDPARGFSYRKPGPLDMRMDPTRGKPASHLVNTMPRHELAAALKEWGDEDDA